MCREYSGGISKEIFLRIPEKTAEIIRKGIAEGTPN